jgi:hypothetical protein
MTDLIEYRRQQQIRKQLKQLTVQLDEQDSKLKQLESLFETHTHAELEEQSTRFATREELKAVKAIIPKPYVHPKKGVCPQKPQLHKHLAKEIIDLEIPKPYDIEQLKKDHPKLRDPYLHPPKHHKHPAEDVTGKIQPEQIQRKGLDADTVDGKHAKDLVKRVYVGGGPHGNMHAPGEADEINADITKVVPLRNGAGYVIGVEYYSGATLRYKAIINRDAEYYVTSIDWYVKDSLKFTLTVNRDADKTITSITRS